MQLAIFYEYFSNKNKKYYVESCLIKKKVDSNENILSSLTSIKLAK